MRQSGQAVDGDDWDAPPVFVAVARRLRISAKIIFFQRREGGAVRKGGAGLWVEVCLCYSGEKTVY